MKARDKNYLITAPFIFIIVWGPATVLLNVAQLDIDPADNFSPELWALVPATILLIIYTSLYYGIHALGSILRKSKNNTEE